jgi:hypothetical protein
MGEVVWKILTPGVSVKATVGISCLMLESENAHIGGVWSFKWRDEKEL